jgi:hypothetical protein
MVEFVGAAAVATAICAVRDCPSPDVWAVQPDAARTAAGRFDTVKVVVTFAADESVTEVRIMRSTRTILNSSSIHTE